jgi:hypothetical protein
MVGQGEPDSAPITIVLRCCGTLSGNTADLALAAPVEWGKVAIGLSTGIIPIDAKSV